MTGVGRRDLVRDLVLPSVLFAALGAMTWAIRGCSGFGAVNGCIFAGVTWGAAWWYLARDPGSRQSRRYSSGWIILALTAGIGLSGSRGWMQWPSFFDGRLQTNTALGVFVPISRAYGFVWLFIAGVPWAGLGACALAWCGTGQRSRARDWVLRIACGLGFALAARMLFDSLPEIFLPLYRDIGPQYSDLASNPNLRRLINDCRAAITHLGLYLGFLTYEAGRKDWRNVVLISTVGSVNGIGWALLQNWKWAPRLWPDASFNWWRCWESSGGISIGVAFGIAYFLVNRRTPAGQPGLGERAGDASPNLERFGAFLGLLIGLGLSLRSGLKGWANIYLGNEEYWSGILWKVFGPAMVLGLAGLVVWSRLRPIPKGDLGDPGDLFPNAYRWLWVVLITQNVLAQLVTGPPRVWNEFVFSIYYVLLLLITGLIVHCIERMKQQEASRTVA